MAENWVDTVDDNGDDIRVLSPARSGRSTDSVIGEDMIGVFMDESDWQQVIVALHENHDDFIADSIQDVLDSL